MVEAPPAAGADPDAKTDGGTTASDLAIDGDHETVVALLERGSRTKR